MMVDISHVAEKTFWDALEVSSVPVFASHSSCRALSNAPRNMTDEMIVALAPKFMAARNPNEAETAAEYKAAVPPATLADVVAHCACRKGWRMSRNFRI
jgi:microsomal dipeptidase-like Zn-dependent dipeptidase